MIFAFIDRIQFLFVLTSLFYLWLIVLMHTEIAWSYREVLTILLDVYMITQESTI